MAQSFIKQIPLKRALLQKLGHSLGDIQALRPKGAIGVTTDESGCIAPGKQSCQLTFINQWCLYAKKKKKKKKRSAKNPAEFLFFWLECFK